MAKYLSVRKRAGVYSIEYNGKLLHKGKDLKFVKGWLENQVKDFKFLHIEL